MDRRSKKSKISASFNSYPHQPVLPIPYSHVAVGLHHYHHHSLHHLHHHHHQPTPPVSLSGGGASALISRHDTFGATTTSTMLTSTTESSWLNHHHHHHHHHHSQPEPVTRCPTTTDGTNNEMEIDTGYYSNTTIENLYPEILSIIFSYLDLRSKGRAAQVCSTWMEACYDKSVWKGVEAKLHLKKINSTMIDSINRRGIKRVQILSFQKSLKELTNIRNLERITLTGCYNLTDEHLSEALSREMPSLKQLSLGMCKQISCIFVSLCRILQNTPNIEVLDLGGCSEITDSALTAIRKCLRKLKQLNLRSCRYITDYGISRLCLDKLTEDLDSWKQYSSSQIAFIKNKFNNETKDKNNNKYSDKKANDGDTIEDMDSGLTTLELLDLQDCQTLTDDSLKYISSGLRNLQSLNLSFCVGITDMGLKYLSSMTSLKEINLRSCTNITDTGLRYLSESGIKLKILDVSFCDKIGDTGLIYISQGLTSLVTLSLNSCSITDQGLIKVSTSLTNLKTLNIGQCNKITDIGVASLAENCLKLENIDLYGCTRITPSGHEKILQLPLLKYLNTGLWQDLETPVYFHPFSPNSLVRDHHSLECVLRSNRNFSTASYNSNQLLHQYKSIYDSDNMFLRNCILTKLCDSCQNVSFLLNPTIHASPLYIVLRLDKS